jgi:hypothetical protein
MGDWSEPYKAVTHIGAHWPLPRPSSDRATSAPTSPGLQATKFPPLPDQTAWADPAHGWPWPLERFPAEVGIPLWAPDRALMCHVVSLLSYDSCRGAWGMSPEKTAQPAEQARGTWPRGGPQSQRNSAGRTPGPATGTGCRRVDIITVRFRPSPEPLRPKKVAGESESARPG